MGKFLASGEPYRSMTTVSSVLFWEALIGKTRWTVATTFIQQRQTHADQKQQQSMDQGLRAGGWGR